MDPIDFHSISGSQWCPSTVWSQHRSKHLCLSSAEERNPYRFNGITLETYYLYIA